MSDDSTRKEESGNGVVPGPRIRPPVARDTTKLSDAASPTSAEFDTPF